MGWITDRHLKTGRSLNGSPERQRKGPLREIVHVIRHSRGIFDPACVELACGHRTHSHGIYKARCVECAAAAREGKTDARTN